MPLHTRILLGLVAGAAAGVAANLLVSDRLIGAVVTTTTQPVGKMWLSALIMVVIPLILSTLSLGVAGLGSLRRLGRIGLTTLLCFLGITALATTG